MKTILTLAVACGLLAGAALPLPAQTAVPPAAQEYQPLASQDLDQLLGPIALYPDPLIAQILPAATLPTQIVLADRYVAGGGDPNQIDNQPWDPSVKALARYPEVLKWMDDNLDWTTALGQAFLNQQDDVMQSIQRLRASAQNMGNLSSTPQQQVVDDGANIEIVPADPEVIYVPIYQPDVVYYQTSFGPPCITFGIGFSIGSWLNCDFDWGHRNLVVWDRAHPRPANWWHERGDQRAAAFTGHTTVWHPVNRPGIGAVQHGDRGWNNSTPAHRPVPHPAPVGGNPGSHQSPPNHMVTPPIHGINPSEHVGTPLIHPANPSRPVSAPPSVQHNNPPPVEHAPPVVRPPSGNAFIGIQSSQETRDFSNRGQQSMQSIPHSAPPPPEVHSAPPPPPPASHSAPPSSSGGGGGGGIGGGGGGGGSHRH